MKCAVVGASGYLGSELLRLLASHPDLDVASVQADSTAGRPLGEVVPALGAAYGGLVIGELDAARLRAADAVFVALPSGASQQLVPELVGAGPVVVDLGADFRLKDAALYPQWYGWEHSCPSLLAGAVYGLPELFRKELAGAGLIASPGCYVTAAAMALAPLVASGLADPRDVIVDAASGTSGAGRSPRAGLHHPLANEAMAAYGLLSHRHTPEMEQVIGARVLFTPHLAPMTRGILATCYARATASATGAGGAAASSEALVEYLRDRYAGEPFVNVRGPAELPSTADAYGSNVVHLTARVDRRSGWIVTISAIDNLVKGGAGQAIQAANLALGLPETAGLPLAGLTP
ncbi:MAG: N-acetyl-gamma-glutamyl-phosphate reductase [Actinomycetota bacterium]|nr:N-acetyl-gamma-glutamyl-phosphate reductase [Actinomycetota bacterium]